MDIAPVTLRNRMPRPFIETDNLPWHQPDFSRRALREQLDQDHDSGTRSESTIARQIPFIVQQLRLSPGDTVLDLACGPGLYAKHLSASGYSVIGIDISPAAIEYARAMCIPNCEFVLGDVRSADYPGNIAGAMLIYGVFNTFSPVDAQLVLRKISKSLRPEGRLILELCDRSLFYCGESTVSGIQGWWCSDRGDLWSDGPYIALKERLYYPGERVEVTRYFIIPQGSSEIVEYTETCVSYDVSDITKMLRRAGLRRVAIHPDLAPCPADSADCAARMFTVVVAEKSN